MSAAPLRESCQVTIAPPVPSNTIVGRDWLFAAVHSATPSAIHCGVPAAFTRWAYMSPGPLRESSQVTIAPPAPSDTTVGEVWRFAAVHSGTPSGVHCWAPAGWTTATTSIADRHAADNLTVPLMSASVMG